MLTSLLVSIIDRSRRLAWPIILGVFILSGMLGLYVTSHFKINTDINQLLSSDLPWRQREIEIEKAFPQKVDNLVIVVDGETADGADYGAAVLADKMKENPTLFTFVERPDAIPFFKKNGLLFLSKEELNTVLGDLIKAQPMLGSLAGDPTLRGLFDTIGTMALGVEHKAADFSQLDKAFQSLTEALDLALVSQDRPLAWQTLMSSREPGPHEMRKVVLVKPKLDYSQLEPGKAARDAIKKIVAENNLTPGAGINVRLTGPVALNDEEFASVSNGTQFATILSLVLVAIILWMALRSLRLIIPILLSLVAGLIVTTAIALMVVKSFNLISIAFAVMFIGIAVDFGIQFGVRYRAQHFAEPDHAKAMLRTARVVALPLAMAAGSTALGFLSFMPTQYRGVSELGFIAGVGMIVAFLLTITFLPAMLAVSRPPAERERIGFKWMAPADLALTKRRLAILLIAFVVAIAGGMMCTELRFDFDPLNLKDPHTESVSTLFDIMKDPDFSTYTIEALGSNRDEAESTAAKLRQLPQVDHVLTLASFIPEDQDAKLAMITDARTLLEPTFNPLSVQRPPNDEQILSSMNNASATLHRIGREHPTADRLAIAIDGVVSRHSHQMLAHVHDDLVKVILTRLDDVREALKAEKVTIDNISDDLRKDWITPDGKALLQAYPKGNARNVKVLDGFAEAVQRIVPDASGSVISIRESGQTITHAFIQAGVYALITIMLMSLIMLRSLRDVIILIAPLILAGILTLATIVVIGLPLNFANIIALPLLLSLGVSYAIYFVTYWRAGLENPLQSSMARAVLFSASTALVAFGSLGLSSHLGTASMGKLLTVALLYSLTCTFFILPALLGRPKADRQSTK